MLFRFGDVIVRLGSRSVERGGSPVHLSPKAFDLLEALIRRRPNVVRTEELHALLWPGVHVGATSLPALIAEIRSALRESPRESGSLRTLPRVGYAFVADTQEVDDAATSAAHRIWLFIENRWVPVANGVTILGREGPGVLEIPGTTVSRQHARLHVSQGEVALEDLGSKNGTWLGGTRVTGRVPLSDGDRFLLGSAQIRISFATPGATTETVASHVLRSAAERDSP
jgi:DNA-binding winged helix-turn-helix (wHTH) protein